MKPIFEFTLDGKKYKVFVDGSLQISDTDDGEIIINRALPILDLLFSLASKHGESQILEVIREFFPRRYPVPHFRSVDVQHKDGTVRAVDIVDELLPIPLDGNVGSIKEPDRAP